ncbi:MAG: O-antigen ligase family protein [Usitatibacter sp.]
MSLIRSAGGAQRVVVASAAGFLLVAPFPASAGWRAFFLLLGALALGWQAWRDREPLDLARVPRVFVLAACAWIALCIASLAWSVDPGYTLDEIRREILYGGLAFVLLFCATRTPRHLHLWLALLLLGGFVLGVCEWLRFMLPDAQWARAVSMGPGPYSTQVLLLAPLLVLLPWPRPVGLARGLGFTLAAGAALIVAGIASDSRMLWIALMVVTLIAFAVFWIETPKDHPGRGSARRALVVALLLLPAMMVIATEYKARFYPRATSTVDTFSFDERPIIWKAAAKFAAERPLLGFGYGREILGARMRAALEKEKLAQPYHHGHNVVLDSELQMGLPGVAAFLLLMGSLAAAFLDARKREGGTAIAIVGVATLAGYFTKNLTDDFFFRPSSLVFWAVAGMLLGLAARLTPRASPPSSSGSR